MKRVKLAGLALAVICSAVYLLPDAATAQSEDLINPAAAAQELAASKALRTGDAGAVIAEKPDSAIWSDLQPLLNQSTLTWIAVVVILVLTLQVKPLLSWHNLDGLMLALVAFLLPLRSSTAVLGDDQAGHTVQWWTYILLSVIGLYWLARGLRLLLIEKAPALGPNVSEGAMLVLIVAGLFVAGSQIVHAPLTDGSRDGLAGGVFTAETGKLPYGDALEHDARSPLLYLLHAGAVQITEPNYGAGAMLQWDNRAEWLSEEGFETVDLTPVRLVNALLFILLVAAMAVIGHRLHSLALGQTLVAILCIFPGVLECLAHPDIMLPTVLMAWGVAFLTIPGVGSLLSVATVMIAGMAWPWAWLALPVLLGYLLRQGWHAFGAVLGLIAGVVAIVIGITSMVAPTVPRVDGALREAGITPTYTARLAEDGRPVIEHFRPSEDIMPDFKKWIWNPLLNLDEVRLDSAKVKPALPNGVGGGEIMYRDVTAQGEARQEMQTQYREAMAREPELNRACAALRTVMEATWKPEVEPTLPVQSAWDLWIGDEPGSIARWTMIRRIGKIVIGVLSLFVAFVLIRGRRGQMHQVIGGVLVVCAGALLVSLTSTAGNWVWVMPAALAALAAKGGVATEQVKTGLVKPPPLDIGPAPRITVEK